MTPDPRLLVPLAELPGFDAAGLMVATWTEYTRNDAEPSGRELFAYIAAGGPLVVERWVGLRLRYRVSADLTDAATRDRLLRWLAGRVGLEVGCGAPTWRPWERQPGERAWEIDTGEGDQTWSPGANGWTHRWLDCPALADLDPTDPTTLPDGSRRVDALALAAVVRAQVTQ